MARKNVFALDSDPLTRVNETEPDRSQPHSRPLADLDVERSNRPSALGAISKSLERINARSEKADEIEKKLTSGQTIIEIETELIENSFISDRLGIDQGDQDKLVTQIREMGQLVPILVRPHPEKPQHFQIAYGHRRVAAAKALGRKVRAIVKQMTDEELVIHQGQENNTRSDLSFIEKAFFAQALEKRGYSRETMHQSTGIDKAILSKMITFVRTIPEAVVIRIGRAPDIGRKRWEQFVAALLEEGGLSAALAAVDDPRLAELSSDDRFHHVFNQIKAAKPKTRAASENSKPTLGNGVQPVEVHLSGSRMMLVFDERVSPGFADLVRSRLNSLFSEYEASRPNIPQ